MALEAVEQAFEALLFGNPAWIFGLMLFVILCVVLIKLWKYSGALIIPIIIALEVMYYEEYSTNEIFVWPMIILIALALLVAAYTVTAKDK